MSDIKEYPKAIYHPANDKQFVIVDDTEAEAEQLEAWGEEAPKLSVGKRRATTAGEGSDAEQPQPDAEA